MEDPTIAALIPFLDLVKDLRAAGSAAELWAILSDVQSAWSTLPETTRAAFLARAGLGGVPPADARVRVLRARGRPAEAPYLSLLIERPDRPSRSFLLRAFYMPYELGAPFEESVAVASTAIKHAWARGRTPIVETLDRAWGGAPYDADVEGPLLQPAQVGQGVLEQVLESYWLHEPFAQAIIYEDARGVRNYHVEEPALNDLERSLMAVVNERIRHLLVLQNGETFGPERVAAATLDLLRVYRPEIERASAYRISYYFIRNYLGAGPLEAIMRDARIEDISCNGPDLPTFVAHSRYQSVRTNILMDEPTLDSFTIKLAQRGGKLLSVAQPLVDATLPDGSRLQAALGREVTSRGSAFTIRKFREDPLTAVDLIRLGTHSLDTMAFLWMAVELRRSLVVMGATASGKTTTLNCLSQFIPPAVKIVSIEDTREITLQHENWLAAVTRDGFGAGGAEGIGMFDLLKAALRQRPEYLIVGEIRGVEGLTLFQAMSTGHTCFSTMHAGSIENAVYRLENAPINVPRVMLTALDFMLLQGQVDSATGPARRMVSLTELSGIDPHSRNLRTNEVFRYDPTTDGFASAANSNVIESARGKLGWSRARLDEELSARRSVLARLVERKERHYTDVARAVRDFNARRELATAERRPAPIRVEVEAPRPGPGRAE